MKSTVKITTCGVVSALAVVLMLGTNIPIMLYTVPALVGILFIIPAFELNLKWAFLCYAVTSVLSFVLPTEREALIMFIGLLGYYPILKIIIEKLPSRVFGVLIKLIVFNIAASGCFFVTLKVLGINIFAFGSFGTAIAVTIVHAVANMAFIIFDFALTRVFNLYFIKFRRQIRRALGIKNT